MSFDPGFITIEDLYVAYRKAKVDTFYERDHATAIAFVEFEAKLSRNLRRLLAELNDPYSTWFRAHEFVGKYSFIPKSIEAHKSADNDRTPAIISNPDAAWAAVCKPHRAKAKFRLVGRHPVHYHVVSALWIQKVGHHFDAILKPCAYASRVRRTATPDGRYHQPCKSSLGSFRPYSFGFRNWRATGLGAMREALKEKKSIIAVTADLRSFYHRASPTFLTKPEFLEKFGIKLSSNQQEFTNQFVSSLMTWAENTPDHQSDPECGLPVGLSAPRLIANTLLHEFDLFVTRELSPLYYGRYVDDVFLVLENTRGFSSSDDVWNYIIKRSDGLIEKAWEGGELVYRVRLEYSNESNLVFAGAKQKVFALEGSSGSSLLEAVVHTVTKRSSDWRLLPDLPKDEEELAVDFLNAGRDATEEVDNLRKADGITVQRLAFALRLRNFEAVRRDLPPDQWRKHREKLYQIALDHVITAQGLFDYHSYIARLVSLSVACGDFERASEIIFRIAKVFKLIGETCELHEHELLHAKDAMYQSCFEAAVKGLASFRHVFIAISDFNLSMILDAFEAVGYKTMPIEKVRRLALRVLQCDLGCDAYREHWIDGDAAIGPLKEPMISLPASVRSKLHLDDARAFLVEAKFPPHCHPMLPESGMALPRAVAFPTRPFTTAEISLLDQPSLRNWDRFRKWVTGLRGREFSATELAIQPAAANPQEACKVKDGEWDANVISVRNLAAPAKPLIALPAFATEHTSWKASVMGLSDPDGDRYFRINRLINDALRARPRPHYFVLPELALPRKWFNLAAHRLEHSGISLIAGLEYEHWAPTPDQLDRPFVSNQVRAALITDILGYPSLMFYEQEKERPAPEEADQLRQQAGKVLKPKNKVVRSIIQHENFHFGILICSELTNIHLRAHFRGFVDALIVPEWNQDINSFSALVEAAALDVHCFVVQVNNRYYGDCRVRAPYKAEYMRDLARIKGGKADYYVLAEIDVPALRAFQSMNLSPPAPLFKPKPDGYEINPRRIELGSD